MNLIEGLTFDDVLLVPKYSSVNSRSEVNTSVDYGRGVVSQTPIVPANMKSVTDKEMAEYMSSVGGLSILHRFMDIDENVEIIKRLNSGLVGVSVGVTRGEYERAEALLGAGSHIYCVDIAHGHHERAAEMVDYLRNKKDDALIIAGNVSTADGAEYLYSAGADVIKVGVGPGSLCTTRIETGNGVPQLTALEDVFNRRKSRGLDYKIIADGGIKNAGDIVKALCFSEAVMVGSLFAGTNEAPGAIIDVNGKKHKIYAGSSTHKTSHIEGVQDLVELKGPVEDIHTRMLEGIKSGCSYQGVDCLLDLQKDPVFVKISNAGLTESRPHFITSR